MRLFRRHLRAIVVLWLIAQAAGVSAFSIGDCCAGHRAAKARPAAPSCHGAPTASHDGASCPMRAANGAACPMHHSKAGGATCVLKGTCGGPVAALTNLFFLHGLVPERTALIVAAPHVLVPLAPASTTLDTFSPPDAPPPRNESLA